MSGFSHQIREDNREAWDAMQPHRFVATAVLILDQALALDIEFHDADYDQEWPVPIAGHRS